PKEHNSSIIVLSKEAPQSKIDLAFDNLRKEYDCILPDGPFKWLEYCKYQFKRIARRNAKIRILILIKGNRSVLAESIERIMPKTANFEIRTLQVTNISYCFTLIDFREMWFPIPSMGKDEAMIITDLKEMIEIAKRQFEALWNDANAKIETQGLQNKKEEAQTIA